MREWWRRLIWTVLALAVLAALVWMLVPEPIPVAVATVDRGTLEVTVDEEGRTRVRERYVVSAPVTGRLRRVAWDAGDVVEVGQPIVQLDPPLPTLLDARTRLQATWQVAAALSAVQAAEARLERVAAERDFAEQEYRRAQRLMESQTITQRELEQAEMTYRALERHWEAARFEKQVAEFELAQARALVNLRAHDVETAVDIDINDQQPLMLRAPVAGRVLRVLQESEAVVSAGTPLLELGDPGQLEVVVDLLSEDAAQVEVGAIAYLERWGGPEVLQGRVRRVEPSGFTDISALGVEEQRVNVIVDLVDSPDAYARLGDGYRVDARIVTWQADDVLRVPTSALFREGDAWMVFRIDAGRAVRQRVEVGRQTPLVAEVLEGLSEGDRVVLYPGDRVDDGVRVSVRQ